MARSIRRARSIAVLAGKGGVTKTALARAISAKATKRGMNVAAFDLDEEQASFRRWMQRRKKAGIEPMFTVVGDVSPLTLARKLESAEHDLIVVDGAAYASKITYEVAKLVDLTVIPTSYSIDDAESAFRVAKGLLEKGIPRDRVVVVFSGVLESKIDHRETKEFFESQGINTIEGYIPLQKGYSKAQDRGNTICEVSRYPGLFTLARVVVDGIIDYALKLK